MFDPERENLDPEKTINQDQSQGQKIEQEPLEEERDELEIELEFGLDDDMAMAAEVIRNFNEIAQKAETPEQKKKLNSLRKKISRLVKKFLKTGRNITLAGTLALGVDYFITHPDLKIKVDEKGNIEYIHPDPETTHILNVLAGRESISFEEALGNFRAIMRVWAEAEGIELPEDFDTYDIDQIDNFLTNASRKMGRAFKPGDFKDDFYEFYYWERMDIPEEESREIYNLVWELEQECGNPKIRFQKRGPRPFGLSGNDIDRAYYNPLENTVYLPMAHFVEQGKGYQSLIAELSHAKQLRDNPFGFYFKSVISALRIFSKGGFDKGRLLEAQDEEYDIPGSLEHEAHSTIEPQLREKYKKLSEIKGTKGKDVNSKGK